MSLALTHLPSPALAACQLTYLPPQPINQARACRQHAAYEAALRRAGLEVRTLNVNLEHPDSVFIEDNAVILDELAVITASGNPARRAETPGIEGEIARLRPVQHILPPAAMEGGDVLRVAKTLYVGISTRTNPLGVQALEQIARPLGYRVVAVPVTGSLHLKTACTALDDETLLANPAWLDLSPLAGFRTLPVPSGEPWAANVLRLGERLLVNAAFPQTVAMLAALGYAMDTVNISEFLKAEAGLTCMSLIFA